jgi:uncharacterized oxidoreductase
VENQGAVMPVFNHDELRRYLRQRLQDAGVATAVADEVADNLVESSLQGHDSHGVTLIPRYIEAIRAGELDPQATPQLLRDAGPVISFHGGNGFGQLTGRLAMEQAILRVRQFGVCIMGLAQTHHLGRIGAWAEQAAAEGWYPCTSLTSAPARWCCRSTASVRASAPTLSASVFLSPASRR